MICYEKVFICKTVPANFTNSLREPPVERSHGEAVILALSDSQLLFEVLERIELPHSIELLIVLPVAALYLAVVSGRKRPDQLVPDPQLLQCAFK